MKNYFITASMFLIAASAEPCAADKAMQQNTSVEQNELRQFFRDYGELKGTAWENWKLTEKEWHRYTEIMEKTPFGIWQHTATPYQILAAYSSSLEEQRRVMRG